MNEWGGKIVVGEPSKTYPKGRICWRCERTKLSVYNSGKVCGPCAEKQARWDAHLLYDAHGWPMNLSEVEIRILALALAHPCKYLPLTTILADCHESTIKSSVLKLTRCGWVFRSRRGVGSALVAEPVKGRRR